MTRERAGGTMAMAGLGLLLLAGCAAPLETVERTAHGPKAEALFITRSFLTNGREPTFDERRMWEDRMDDRVSRYLRAHPEMERTPRYSDFRFWRQVSLGSARGEVRALLEEPEEETVDPALMAALAKQHWPEVSRRAREAWVYPPGWVIYFDEGGVTDVVRRMGAVERLGQ